MKCQKVDKDVKEVASTWRAEKSRAATLDGCVRWCLWNIWLKSTALLKHATRYALQCAGEKLLFLMILVRKVVDPARIINKSCVLCNSRLRSLTAKSHKLLLTKRMFTFWIIEENIAKNFWVSEAILRSSIENGSTRSKVIKLSLRNNFNHNITHVYKMQTDLNLSSCRQLNDWSMKLIGKQIECFDNCCI